MAFKSISGGSGNANIVEQELVLAAFGQAGDSLTIDAKTVISVKKETVANTLVDAAGNVNVSYDTTVPTAVVTTVENLLNASITYQVSALLN